MRDPDPKPVVRKDRRRLEVRSIGVSDGANKEPDPAWLAHALGLSSVLAEVGDFHPPLGTWQRLPALAHGVTEDPAPVAMQRPGLPPEQWGRWRARLVEMAGHVQEGLIAVDDHADRVREIEERVLTACRAHYDEFTRMPGTVAFRARSLTNEYQAFLFAERRALE